MISIQNSLRDPIWQGIAAWVAILAFVYFMFDRYMPNIKVKVNINSILFVLSGLIVGDLSMSLGFGMSSFLRSVFGENIYIHGSFGEFLFLLSNFRLGVWGFNSSAPVLNLQIGAGGLYFGMLIGLISAFYFGKEINYDWKLTPFWHTGTLFIVIFAVLLIGLVNFVLSL